MNVAERADGVFWSHFRLTAEENGQPITIFWREFAQFLPPRYLRMALISFTIATGEDTIPCTRDQLSYLREHLPQLQFGKLMDFEK